MNAEPPADTFLPAIRAGDDAAFDQLVARLQRPLFTFAWRYLHQNEDAEDVVVETFVRLFHHRERLRDDTRIEAWLFTTLANLCHNRHRWRTRHPETSLDATVTEFAGNAALPGDAMERDEAGAAVRHAIEQLPHDQRTVILLYHYEHLSYREISAIVGCSERGVETRLYRAKQQLRTLLEDRKL